ncbi:hypothetical protein HETIRDRAFT_117521 [Heterobasidion irregulare TC 32-1]|uniref:Uncharacterized protein n=1 Tax=Heterobasidion irregulare (strain TC 32-1) TaxID=747525 RepID=W4K0U7_HETIT|nr:uncharacterized protein HETIRDRAFT_117521 [Heterobasidion irregulare TC 32-1]ETW78746.1 hypothetical protein HETIRDRAFT_117521 [Heterobasidion irregulare TC 32-1]
MRRVLDRLQAVENDKSNETNPVLCQTEYGSLDLTEIAKLIVRTPRLFDVTIYTICNQEPIAIDIKIEEMLVNEVSLFVWDEQVFTNAANDFRGVPMDDLVGYMAELTKHRLKGPDARCSTEIEMYTK